MAKVSWQTETQLQDLAAHERLHLTCKGCGYQWYKTLDDWVDHREHKYLYVDEIPKLLRCPMMGCGRREFRIARPFLGDTEAFVGGMP